MINLPALPSLGIVLLQAPRQLCRERLTTLTVQLALLGPVRVLDGGNCFDGLRLARELRRHRLDYQTCLQRVSIARAFTCYQMTALLSIPPVENTPTLVWELLATFTDENVPLHERQHLLRDSLPRLKNLGSQVPVFISAASGAEPFGAWLAAWADQVWQFEDDLSQMVQGRLF